MAIVPASDGVGPKKIGNLQFRQSLNGNAQSVQTFTGNRNSGTPGGLTGTGSGLPPSSTARGSTGRGTRANMSTSGAGFKLLDQSITGLDAAYESSADKPAWAAAAAAYAGEWDLCANCQPDSGAKKFFRQWNFNRQLIGLPILLAPLPLAPADSPFGLNSTSTDNRSSGVYIVDLFVPPPSQDFLIIACVGSRLSNPRVLISPADFSTGLTSGPVWAYFVSGNQTLMGTPPVGFSSSVAYKTCIAFPNGQPLRSMATLAGLTVNP